MHMLSSLCLTRFFEFPFDRLFLLILRRNSLHPIEELSRWTILFSLYMLTSFLCSLLILEFFINFLLQSSHQESITHFLNTFLPILLLFDQLFLFQVSFDFSFFASSFLSFFLFCHFFLVYLNSLSLGILFFRTSNSNGDSLFQLQCRYILSSNICLIGEFLWSIMHMRKPVEAVHNT